MKITYQSKPAARRDAQRALSDMYVDIRAHGMTLKTICVPGASGYDWTLVAANEDGERIEVRAATLDEAYLMLLHYPDLPPPF